MAHAWASPSDIIVTSALFAKKILLLSGKFLELKSNSLIVPICVLRIIKNTSKNAFNSFFPYMPVCANSFVLIILLPFMNGFSLILFQSYNNFKY